MIFTSGKIKTGICNWPDRSAATASTILTTKKTKTAKDIFDKKSLLLAYL